MNDILDLEGWTVSSAQTEGDEFIIDATYTVQPSACQKCGVIGGLYKHGPKPIYIRDSPIRGTPVRIRANAQRYKCRECGGTFIQPLGGIHDEMRMTSRCVRYIEKQSLQDTFTRTADYIGCDDKTVRSIASGYIERLNAEYEPYLPEWLGIDETKLDGQMRCILTDVGINKPIDILKDREKPTVTHWLWRFRDLGTVKGLAIDMWRPYKDAARAVFPNLPVVIDKFHVVRMANTCMDRVRIHSQKVKDKETRISWKRNKLLLLKRAKNLTEQQRFTVQIWLDNEPDVAAAYQLKERFFDIYDLPKSEAIEAFDAFTPSVPKSMKADFNDLTRAMRNWRSEILAYFDHPISNGYTEALNGVAKVINRTGRGYSFEVMRARLLFKDKARVITEAPMEGFFRSYPTAAAMEGHRMLVAALGNRCESCFGIYELLEAHRIPPLASEKRGKVLYICPDCYARFHTEALSHGSQAST